MLLEAPLSRWQIREEDNAQLVLSSSSRDSFARDGFR
jgi:hypothetical protein